MPEVAVRPSQISGLGVFTLDRIRAGQVVREFKPKREVTPECPLRLEQGEHPEHCPLIDGRFYLVGSPDRYFNHCCDPNVYLRFEANRIDVVARRDIEAGCELTLDYLINNPGGDSWPCIVVLHGAAAKPHKAFSLFQRRCSASTCRFLPLGFSDATPKNSNI
jgi:SET domain-containing protein